MHEQNLLVVIQDVDPQLQEPKKGWLSFAKSLLYTCALPSMKIRVEHSSFSTRLHKQRSLLQPKFIRNINKKNFSNLKNIGALYYVSLKIYYHIILGTTSSGNPLDIQSKSPKINKRQSSTKSITKFKNNTSIRKLEGKRYPNEIGNLTERKSRHQIHQHREKEALESFINWTQSGSYYTAQKTLTLTREGRYE